jgi:glutamate---cysteine ligase / carboxylate-amine ligase
LHVIMQQGPLARRILRATGPSCTKAHLQETYRVLCDCLQAGRMFVG